MPTGNPGQTKVATGNVTPCSFVKIATTADGKCTICGAGDKIFGISGPSERNPPLTGLQDGFHAIAGENVKIYTQGARDVMLTLGGAVSPGDRLKSDGSGFGVATTTNLDEWFAMAMAAGTTGQRIPVDCIGPIQISS